MVIVLVCFSGKLSFIENAAVRPPQSDSTYHSAMLKVQMQLVLVKLLSPRAESTPITKHTTL